MQQLTNPWIRIPNDIVHDLAAGAWPGTAVALWLVRSRAERALPPGTFAESAPALSAVFVVMLGALALLVLTGILRINYRTHGISPTMVKTRNRTVLIKHAVFAVVFIFATVLAIASLQP